MRTPPKRSRSLRRFVAASIAGATLVVPGVADGAQVSASGGESVEISFVGSQPPELVQPVIDAFEASQDQITVRYEAVPFEEMSAIIAQRVGDGTGDIDVFYADAPRNPSIVDAGYALDLTELIGVEALEGVVPQASIDTAVIDDRMWTVPMRTSTQILYYNIDLLEQAGIETPSMDPEQRITWEELKELAIQAQEPAPPGATSTTRYPATTSSSRSPNHSAAGPAWLGTRGSTWT